MTNSISPSLYPRPEVYSSFNALNDLREYLDQNDSEEIAYRITMNDESSSSTLVRLKNGQMFLAHGSCPLFDRIRKMLFQK